MGGTCVCDSRFGWSGPNCSLWNDPCLQHSFDGCMTCVTSTPVNCQYCTGSDFRCIADQGQAGIFHANASRCTAGHKTSVTRSLCTSYQYPHLGGGELNIVIVVAAFVLMSLMACIGVLALCCCRKVPPNPLLVNAVTGTPDYQRPRREREVMQVQ